MELDGNNFQGRLLHILPASSKKTHKIGEDELAKLPVKKQRQIKRKMESTSTTFNWNSLYMNVSSSWAKVLFCIETLISDIGRCCNVVSG